MVFRVGESGVSPGGICRWLDGIPTDSYKMVWMFGCPNCM